MRRTWDLETDVLVIGYGAAGGVAATAASDAGAEVLILEKGPCPGGCSILSGGGIRGVESVAPAVRYLTAISGGRVGPDLIETFAQALAENESFIRKLAEVNRAEIRTTRGEIAHGGYPYAGRETFYLIQVARIPGFSRFPWVRAEYPPGLNMMKLVIDNVEHRDIEVRLSTAAKRLEVDESGAVVGAVAESEGRQIAVRARRAVVLATGGFEHNEWLKKQYLQGTPFYSMAPLTHTGDGVLMAQKVGAALWHMWHVHGGYGFKAPDSPIAYRNALSGPRNPKRKLPWIVVDKFGSRYMNEFPPAPQDTGHRAMEIFDPDLPGYPRIPSYMIFDEVGRRRGPVFVSMGFPGCEYEWSQDNAAEIDKGWILRANSIAELALAIRERCPGDEGRMDAARLEVAVGEWNTCVESGDDPFHRLPGTMMPIATPPFYAAEVWPIITNTQGGPVHDVRQQVIDPFGQPIQRLYAAGELGSFFGHLYQLGGNLSECFISGRIAGTSAAAERRL